MTQDLHDDPRIDALREQQRGAGITQVVEALRGKPARARYFWKAWVALLASNGRPPGVQNTRPNAGSRQRTKRGNYEGSIYQRSDGR